ncbi:hypothetical protein ECZC10_52130 [Escherichia coli]|nr:hypothetical protein ECZC10_52130 [Escherichia coli]
MPDRSFRATNLSRNIDNVRALLAHLLYHVKVLSAQHVDVISGVRTLRKQHVGWSGKSNGDRLIIAGADTRAITFNMVAITLNYLQIRYNEPLYIIMKQICIYIKHGYF